jgi:hypothetical protein
MTSSNRQAAEKVISDTAERVMHKPGEVEFVCTPATISAIESLLDAKDAQAAVTSAPTPEQMEISKLCDWLLEYKREPMEVSYDKWAYDRREQWWKQHIEMIKALTAAGEAKP